MITLNKPIYSTLVKYFYSNFSFDRSICFVLSFMKEKIIEFDCNVLDQILSIPSDSDRYFNITCWSHNRLGYLSCIRTIFEDDSLRRTAKPNTYLLSLENKLFHYIFTFNFLSRRGHRHNVSHVDINFLKIVLLGDRVNLLYLMIHHMNECFQISKSVSYGVVMTTIFKTFDISTMMMKLLSSDPLTPTIMHL